MEAEALAITSELNSGDNPPGVSSSLVDAEGFPRGDIDIYHVRSLRNRLAILQTDHRSVMRQVRRAVRGGVEHNTSQIADTIRIPPLSLHISAD